MNTLQLFPELISKASKTYDDFIFSDALGDIVHEGDQLYSIPLSEELIKDKDAIYQGSDIYTNNINFFDTHSSYQALHKFNQV